MRWRSARSRTRRHVACAIAAVLLAGCGSSNGLPVAQPSQSSEPSLEPDGAAPTDPNGDDASDPGASDPLDASSEQPSAQVGEDGHLVIDPEAVVMPFSRRLLGTNVPAWLGPERLGDPGFQAETVESGTTLLRMPGGSWSNSYDWLACELADEDGCYWLWAARPSDFIDFLDATGLEGMWTASINDTAETSAAAVAFFNGEVGDERVIGTDQNGFDWGTVGDWAELRTNNGHPDPVGIQLWEVGNEVYGGRPDTGGDQCEDFGWEHVWTCDGREYVLGTADHDGFLTIRDAMLAVDPTIEVGAVGVPDPFGWNDWGVEVIDEAGDALDFYVVHQYAFGESPGPAALVRPATLWPPAIAEVRSVLDTDVPIAVTEYNLVGVETNDTNQDMTRALNAFYIADSIGQLAMSGVEIANQWNLANGRTSSGTDYGMISADDGSRYPQYEALAMWSRAGTTLLEQPDVPDGLRVYPTRHDDGRLTIIVINLFEDSAELTFEATGVDPAWSAELVTVSTSDLGATTMAPPVTEQLGAVDPFVAVSIPAWSINAIEIGPDAD